MIIFCNQCSHEKQFWNKSYLLHCKTYLNFGAKNKHQNLQWQFWLFLARKFKYLIKYPQTQNLIFGAKIHMRHFLWQPMRGLRRLLPSLLTHFERSTFGLGFDIILVGLYLHFIVKRFSRSIHPSTIPPPVKNSINANHLLSLSVHLVLGISEVLQSSQSTSCKCVFHECIQDTVGCTQKWKVLKIHDFFGRKPCIKCE